MKKNTKSNALKTYLITLVLVCSGVIAFTTVFPGVFNAADYIEMSSAIAVIIILSAVFTYLFSLVKRDYIPFLILIAAALIYFAICHKSIIAGFCTYGNTVADIIYKYFGIDGIYFIVTNKMRRAADETQMLYFIIVVMTIIYSFCITKFRAVIIPFSITLLALAVPLATERQIPVMVLIFAVVFCLESLVVLLSSKHSKESLSGRLTIMAASIIMGVFVMAAGFISTRIITIEDYERPDFWLDLKDWAVDKGEKAAKAFGIDINDGNGKNSVKTLISAGDLSNLDDLHFEGNEVLKIMMPSITDDSLYLAGFVGENFIDREWTTADERNIENKINENYEILPNMLTARYYRYNYYDVYWVIEEIEDVVDSGYEYHPGYLMNMYTNSKTKELSFLTNIDLMIADMSFDDALNYDLSDAEAVYRSYVYDHYLEVDTPVNAPCVSEAAKIESISEYARMMAVNQITEWLQQRCSYSTTPEKIPDDADFVDYFLNTSNEGYCVFFATAAVELFRAAGIPARYVEGYTVTSNNANTSYDEETGLYTISIKDSDAHAWVEYYLDGIGWITCDVTPATSNNEPVTDDWQEMTTPEPTTEEITTPEETESQTEAATAENTTTATTEATSAAVNWNVTEDEGVKLHKIILKVFKIIGIIIVSIDLIIVCLYAHYKIVEKKRERVYNDKSVIAARKNIFYDYSRAEGILKSVRVTKSESESYSAFGKRAVEAKILSEEEADIFVKLYEKAVFSQEDISEIEKQQFNNIILSMRERILGKMGKIKRLWFRYIINF